MRDLPEYGRLLVAVILAVLVLSASVAAVAQTRSPDVPVLVVGVDDPDPRNLRRTHEFFRRVIAELKGVMSRAGFSVIEEEAVAVDLKWKIRDRFSKTELLELVKDINRSDNATHGIQALVALSIHKVVRRLNSWGQGHNPDEG